MKFRLGKEPTSWDALISQSTGPLQKSLSTGPLQKVLSTGLYETLHLRSTAILQLVPQKIWLVPWNGLSTGPTEDLTDPLKQGKPTKILQLCSAACLQIQLVPQLIRGINWSSKTRKINQDFATLFSDLFSNHR